MYMVSQSTVAHKILIWDEFYKVKFDKGKKYYAILHKSAYEF